MLIPAACPSCGSDIGSIAPLFSKMRAKKAKEKLAESGAAPTMAAADRGLQIDCSEIFDSLLVDSDCCRMAVATSMRFTDYY